MHDRFLEFKELLWALDQKEDSELMLADEEMAEAGQLCERLQRLVSVTVELQDDIKTLYSARVIFVSVIEAFPNLKWCISSKANIAENVNFDNALVKIH